MTDSENCFSNLLFVFQLIAAPAGGFIFGLIASELLDQVSGTRNNQLAGWLCYAFVGFAQGFLTQSVFPRSECSGGRFIWVLPVCVLAVSVFAEYRHGLETVFREFLVLNPYSFAQGFVSGFVTMPAFASCLYSLGILAAHRPVRATQGET
jgi:hypothetical protein